MEGDAVNDNIHVIICRFESSFVKPDPKKIKHVRKIKD